jgi:poly-gamma-glutamate system protein
MEVRSLKPDSSELSVGSGHAVAHSGWRNRPDLLLVALALLGMTLHWLVEGTKQMKPQPFLNEKLAAATRTDRCFVALRLARLGAPPTQDQENDPQASGLIGQEHTLTTTDRGVLEAKITTINPNFAAIFVEYFHKVGLKAGDAVAFSVTGSFPALNVAGIAAAEEMRLRPIVITSVGASMWGANDPTFTWLDMERLLNERKLLQTQSVAASIGGSNDRGRGLSPKGRSLLRDAIERSKTVLISEPTLEQAVGRRIEIYDREAGPRGVRAFVNIGGGSASLGNAQNANLIRPGVSRMLPPYNWTQKGALHAYAKRGVPIIHILNVESIASTHGLPLTPEAVPPVGEGEIFHRPAYDLRVALPALLTYLVLCFGVLRARQRAARAAREIPDPVIPGLARQPVGERSRG